MQLGQRNLRAQCQVLCQQREAINPRQLRRDIEKMFDHLFAYPGADPDQVENVYETWLTRTLSRQLRPRGCGTCGQTQRFAHRFRNRLNNRTSFKKNGLTPVTLSFDRTVALH